MAMTCENCCNRRSSLGALPENCRQRFAVDSKCRTLNLRDGPRGRGAKARHQRQADKTFLAHQTYFHTLSVREDAQNGHQAAACRNRPTSKYRPAHAARGASSNAQIPILGTDSSRSLGGRPSRISLWMWLPSLSAIGVAVGEGLVGGRDLLAITAPCAAQCCLIFARDRHRASAAERC